MTAWAAVPWAAFLAGLGAALLSFREAVRATAPTGSTSLARDVASTGSTDAAVDREGGTEAWTRRLAWTAAGLTVLTFLYLASRFAVLDLSYQYVWTYTRHGLPLQYRLAGTWTGREGSLILWTSYLALVAAVVGWWHRRSPAADDAEAKGRAWTRFFLAALVAAFLAAVATQDTFAPTPDFVGRPDGNGLNPTLQSPFILIHPPVMFLAYALTALPAAAALGHLVSGTDRWSRIALTGSRVDWILYTFAMGLGGIWAYYTLGFGGYWAWDPVEVANLLPWLALTLFLHAQVQHLRHGRFRVAGPFLAMLPLLLTLFSTISTRSGLWVSVHAFTDPSNTFDADPLRRFLQILAIDDEAALVFYVGLAAAVWAMGLALWTRRLAVDHGTLPRTARALSALFGAFAVFALLDPQGALGLLFDGAAWVGRGHTGLGLLVLTFLPSAAAVAPALLHDAGQDPRLHGRPLGRRLDMGLLAYVAVLVLGIGLLVVFLFHMAAVRGWSPDDYVLRFPVLATPPTLGILVLLTFKTLGTRRSLLLAGGTLAAALVAAALFADHRIGAYVVVLTLVPVGAALDRVRRAAVPAAAGRGWKMGAGLLLLAAMLDLMFWLDPPSTVLGTWHPVWPVQMWMGGLAVLGLWGTVRLATGVPFRPSARGPGPSGTWVFLLVGLLGAYYVAPLLAAAAWSLMRSGPGHAPRTARTSMRQAALYGLHLAVVVALLGYGISTYFSAEQDTRLAVGDSVTVGGQTITFTGTDVDAETGTPWAAALHPRFHVEGRSEGEGKGTLYWEVQSGSYFPLPDTVRFWDRDVYLFVQEVCTGPAPAAGADSGPDCPAASTTRAFQSSPRLPADTIVQEVRLTVSTLPGLGLVWLALALFVTSGVLLVATDSKTGRP